MEDYIQELYKLANGSMSHYLFLYDCEPLLLKKLVAENYLKFVPNGSSKKHAKSSAKPMYCLSLKAIEVVEGPVAPKDLRRVQITKYNEDTNI